ncbi:MAG: hypothetical protein KME22_08285 [Hassallia sp. WJT32-NPBG1]|nr:hypothetical protein [Hassallia sp. WJT32-NPBG1]
MRILELLRSLNFGRCGDRTNHYSSGAGSGSDFMSAMICLMQDRAG